MRLWWRGLRPRRWRRLPLLQLLLLLHMLLLQLLCLLRVLLFYLLLPGVIRALFRHLLMFLVLLLLEFLAVLLLLRHQLFLLLLVFLICLWIARVWRRWMLHCGKFVRMNWIGTVCSCIVSRSHYAAIPKRSRPRSCRHCRRTVIGGETLLRVRTRCLDMFVLCGHARSMALVSVSLFPSRGARIYAAVASIEADARDMLSRSLARCKRYGSR